MRIKNMTMIAMLTAMAVVISYLESFFPFLGDMVPGLKLGLANIVILYTLYRYGFKMALLVSLVRVFIVALIRTGFGFNFFFSLAGAIFSIIAMALTKKTKLSVIGVSVVGSLAHSIGQVLMGCFLLSNSGVWYYLPYLLILCIPTGTVIGMVTKRILKYTEGMNSF